MQGSVHRFDPQTGSGSVLLDDGTEVTFDANAFTLSGLRLLRVGQRLGLELDGDGADLRAIGLRLFGI
jgi:2-phospho-L-lactate/phosphoenolpyruvate guanylyltransferase